MARTHLAQERFYGQPSTLDSAVSVYCSRAHKPTASDVASPLSHDVDPWDLAYKIFQEREPELTADYAKYLASVQGDAAASIDLSVPRSVESIVTRLSEDREKKQRGFSLLGTDIRIREQTEKLTKFLLWSNGIVKNALSAQTFAALAYEAFKHRDFAVRDPRFVSVAMS